MEQQERSQKHSHSLRAPGRWLGVSKNTSRIGDSWEEAGTQHRAVITADLLRERMQSKVSPGARRWVVKSRGPASSVLSSGVAQDALNSPSHEPRRRCTVVSSRDALESLRPRFLRGGWSHEHPLPDTHPHPRLAGGQQEPSAGPTVCTHGLGWGAACHSWGWGGPGPSPGPSSQMPVEGPPWKQAFWGPASKASVLTLLHILLILRGT